MAARPQFVAPHTPMTAPARTWLLVGAIVSVWLLMFTGALLLVLLAALSSPNPDDVAQRNVKRMYTELHQEAAFHGNTFPDTTLYAISALQQLAPSLPLVRNPYQMRPGQCQVITSTPTLLVAACQADKYTYRLTATMTGAPKIDRIIVPRAI